MTVSYGVRTPGRIFVSSASTPLSTRTGGYTISRVCTNCYALHLLYVRNMKHICIQQPVSVLGSKAYKYNTKASPVAWLLFGGWLREGSVNGQMVWDCSFKEQHFVLTLYRSHCGTHQRYNVRGIWLSTSRKYFG